MSAAEVLAMHQQDRDGFECMGCDWKSARACVTDDAEFAAHQLDALKAAGYAVMGPAGHLADNTVEPTPTTTRTTDDMRAEARELARLCTLTDNPWIQDLLRDLAIHTHQTADSFDAEAQK